MDEAQELYRALLLLPEGERELAKFILLDRLPPAPLAERLAAAEAEARRRAGELALALENVLSPGLQGLHADRLGPILFLAAGTLPEGEGAALGGHLDGCDPCRRLYADARRWRRDFQRHGEALLDAEHPRPERIAALARGEAAGADADRLRAHLLLCPLCAAAARRPARRGCLARAVSLLPALAAGAVLRTKRRKRG